MLLHAEINMVDEEEKSKKTANMHKMKERLVNEFPEVFTDKLSPETHMKVPKVGVQVKENFKMPKKAYRACEPPIH